MARKKLFYYIFIVTTVVLLPLQHNSLPLKADETDYYRKIQSGLTYFQKVYKQINLHYVEEIDPYQFVKSGIDGMLGALDPYTVFIEQEGDVRLRIITTGKYGGLGMEIGMRNDEVTVISPMDNSPAKRAGIRAGDIIKKINGEKLSSLSTQQISERLRGPIGSEVEIAVHRPGYEGEIVMNIKRGEIVIEDVNYAAFVEPGIAYVRLTGFTEKAGIEVIEAIKQLQKQARIEAFILDLRGNSGGLLESAVDIAGIFVPKNTVIVTTKGFREGNFTFKTRNEPLLPDIPVAVLVNGGSASASEIVAGALQDLDRAIIVGTETFGKGLVQKVYNIDKDSNTKVKITTAKYYIPSGRCIQRKDYSEDNTVIFNDDAPDSAANPALFYTANHREVYEKGGIHPDEFVDDDEIHRVLIALWKKSVLFNFAVHYYQSNPELNGDLVITDNIFDQFVEYVGQSDFEYEIEGEKELTKFISEVEKNKLPKSFKEQATNILTELRNTKDHDLVMHKAEIKKALLSELAEKYFGSKGKIKYELKHDDQLHVATNVLRNKTKYNKILAIK